MRRLGVQAAVVGQEMVAGDVAVDEGRIASLGLAPAGRSGIAAPGFVDLQVNGFAGVDFTDADTDGMRSAGESLLSTGVTAFQPTLITLSEDAYLAALSRLRQAQAELDAPRLLGVHLEGPFLSPRRPGAHDPSLMLDPDEELARRLLEAGPVTYVTVAPELPGALGLIELLVGRGLTVAVGHSDADTATTMAAFDRGARAVTHLFNAQRPFHHREGGIGFAGLARRDVVVSVINDGIHLADETVRVVISAARGRVSLITDAVSAARLEPGSYTLGNREIFVTEEDVRLEDGTLAGSILTMDRAVRNLIERGTTLTEAVAAATTVPARLIGRPELGTLAPGTPADVAVLDDGYRVRATLVGGEERFRA
ncbi:MAG: N-acetylglucosamine-6-phosphate deacetylase [Actinomycetota bacterium]